MNRLLHEQRFPLRQKSRLGINRSPVTLRRWIDGIKSPKTGKIVKLEAIFEGQGYATSPEAVKRFLAKLNDIDDGECEAVTTPVEPKPSPLEAKAS